MISLCKLLQEIIGIAIEGRQWAHAVWCEPKIEKILPLKSFLLFATITKCSRAYYQQFDRCQAALAQCRVKGLLKFT